ncbi:type IV secretion system protein [Massilia sp. R2A-15]|uniref:type IV secretion system protein n=1 Tax=Massilia sp. R2A-15 TaxID=3064278 RepID=UPI0027354CD2|nr:type IV secretion system protein [Massilia sp. R2A-15]WLI87821.1 type IV secretion system protein [Massilia sp. R2A-15]
MDADSTTHFFAESVSFDESFIDGLKKSVKAWRTFAFLGWTVATVGMVSSVSMVMLHEFVPVIARVDRLTGAADVTVGIERVNLGDPANERMMVADLVRYTKAREGFTRGEAENNYVTVYVMSDPGMRGAWDAEYRADRNPHSLISTLGVRDQIKLTNISVSFLPTDSPKYRVAQVRYSKERHVGTSEPTTQHFASTLTFTYDAAAIPKTPEGVAVNFAGFQALNYRRDEESEEMRIRSAEGEPSTAVFPVVPATVGVVAERSK